jgi:hypothetical protein
MLVGSNIARRRDLTQRFFVITAAAGMPGVPRSGCRKA